MVLFCFVLLVLAVDFNKSLTQLEALQQQIINSLQNNDSMMMSRQMSSRTWMQL